MAFSYRLSSLHVIRVVLIFSPQFKQGFDCARQAGKSLQDFKNYVHRRHLLKGSIARTRTPLVQNRFYQAKREINPGNDRYLKLAKPRIRFLMPAEPKTQLVETSVQTDKAVKCQDAS